MVKNSDARLLILRVGICGVGARHPHMLVCDRTGALRHSLSRINGENTLLWTQDVARVSLDRALPSPQLYGGVTDKQHGKRFKVCSAMI